MDAQRHELILAHLGFARARAEQMVRARPWLAHHRADLYSVAWLALVEAARTWKPQAGSYTTVAWWWLRGLLMAYVRRQSRAVAGPCREDILGEDVPLDAPAHPDDDRTVVELLEGPGLDLSAMEEEELVALLAQRLAGTGYERGPRWLATMHVRARVRGEYVSDLAQEAGMSPQGLHKKLNATQHFVEQLAADLRQGAA